MQRKEGFNQKMQENKPALELKNTEKKMCQKSKLKKKFSTHPSVGKTTSLELIGKCYKNLVTLYKGFEFGDRP